MTKEYQEKDLEKEMEATGFKYSWTMETAVHCPR